MHNQGVMHHNAMVYKEGCIHTKKSQQGYLISVNSPNSAILQISSVEWNFFKSDCCLGKRFCFPITSQLHLPNLLKRLQLKR